MKKQIVVGLGSVAVLIVLLGVIKFFQISSAIAQSKMFGPPPEAVTSMVVKEEQWPNTIFATGALAASQGAMLSAEVGGRISRVLFESGQHVEAGAILVEIDSSVEEAQLRGAEAVAEAAKRKLARAKTLRESNANSNADLDSAEAASREAAANVDSLRASIARRKIVAPFSGTTGIRAVNVGQYVSPGSAIAPLFAIDVLYLNFTVPQQALSHLAKEQSVRFTLDSYPGETFEGKVSALNPMIDSATRNIDVQAMVPNPNGKLRAGMFAQVDLMLGTADSVIAVPTSGIAFAPYGDTVWVIENMKSPDGKEYRGVRQQIVKLGARRGDLVAVLSGLKAGETVVTSGPFKLRANAAVAENNSIAPSSELKPAPANS